MIKLIACDLDDTLTPEIEFVKSGFLACASVLEKSCGISKDRAYEAFWQAFKISSKHVFDRALEKFGLSDLRLKNKLVETYRYHKPNINFYPDVPDFFKAAKNRNMPLAIITDGDAKTQKNKIKALGAEKFFKNGIQLMRRDGFSLILKINPYFSIILLRPKQNSGTRIAVCDGIFKDIVEYPGQFFRVSKDDCIFLHIQFNAVSMLLQQRIKFIRHLCRDFCILFWKYICSVRIRIHESLYHPGNCGNRPFFSRTGIKMCHSQYNCNPCGYAYDKNL